MSEKASIEDRGRALDEEQKQLKIRIKVLSNQIIQELRKKNDSKRDRVNQLKSAINDLESQLNAIKVSAVEDTNDSIENNKETLEASVAYPKDPQEIVGEAFSVTEVQEEIEDDLKGKKKRRFP